jgi:glycoside/pentoside/hexuronide:cation symporter, GPH family
MMSDPTAPAKASSLAAPPQVPTSKRVLWGMGGITDCMIKNGVNSLIDQIYTIAMAIDPKWIGIARSIPRFLDIITDPLVGHLSDNTRSRWGRRKPWMLAGLIILALTTVLMWYPPMSLGPVAVSVFIVVMLFLLFTVGYALFTIPYTAMGYEMSSNSDERTHLFKYSLLGFTFVGLLTPWLNLLCLELEGDQSEVFKGLHGVHWVSWGAAGIIVITGLMPILFCKDVTHGHSEQKVPFAQAVRHTMRNRAFWPLVLGNFIMRFGMSVTGIFFYYVFVYGVGNTMKAGATEYGWFATAINSSTLAGTLLVAWLSERAGKKQTVITLMGFSALAYASVWWVFQPELAGTRWYLATGVGIGLFCNTMPMIINSMLADVCDFDELNTGHRREAFYGAVFITSDKIAFAVTLFLQGFLLQASGFNAKLDHQSPETVATWMKWLLLTQPTGFILGIVCILAYPLTKGRLQDIRRQIDARKALGATR